ncbi:hypothetical protein NU195Hw_g330t1 [Hortaea werneckii]
MIDEEPAMIARLPVSQIFWQNCALKASHISLVCLFWRPYQIRKDLVEKGVAEEVLMIPGPSTDHFGSGVLYDAVYDLPVKWLELVPIFLEVHWFFETGEGGPRFYNYEEIDVWAEGVQPDLKPVKFRAQQEQIVHFAPTSGLLKRGKAVGGAESWDFIRQKKML